MSASLRQISTSLYQKLLMGCSWELGKAISILKLSLICCVENYRCRSGFQSFISDVAQCHENNRLRGSRHQIYFSAHSSSLPFLFLQDPPRYIFINLALMYVQNKGSKEAAKAVINYFYNNQNLYE